MNRNRLVYSLFVILTIASGLASRHYSTQLPSWVQLDLGDALWAMMVFCFGVIFHHKSTLWAASAALAYSIEISQLYYARWIDALRSNRLGGLVLGFGFLWSDLIAYTAGIAFGYVLEKILLRDKGTFW